MEDTKKEEKKIEPEAVEVETIQPTPSAGSGKAFRYMDPACTNIAYYTTVKSDKHPQPTCNNCGANLGAVEQDRFIPLTDDEKASLKALAV